MDGAPDAHRVTFEVKRHGYDSKAVDAHLEEIAARYDELLGDRDRLSARVSELEETLDGYRGLEQKVGNALLVAEGAAATVRERAQAESEEIIKQGHLRAAEIVGDSRLEHNKLLEDVESLRALRSELVSSYKAFLLSALELIEKHSEVWPVERRLAEAATEEEAGEDHPEAVSSSMQAAPESVSR
jgi:cell division initiation protein